MNDSRLLWMWKEKMRKMIRNQELEIISLSLNEISRNEAPRNSSSGSIQIYNNLTPSQWYHWVFWKRDRERKTTIYSIDNDLGKTLQVTTVYNVRSNKLFSLSLSLTVVVVSTSSAIHTILSRVLIFNIAQAEWMGKFYSLLATWRWYEGMERSVLKFFLMFWCWWHIVCFSETWAEAERSVLKWTQVEIKMSKNFDFLSLLCDTKKSLKFPHDSSVGLCCASFRKVKQQILQKFLRCSSYKHVEFNKVIQFVAYHELTIAKVFFGPPRTAKKSDKSQFKICLKSYIKMKKSSEKLLGMRKENYKNVAHICIICLISIHDFLPFFNVKNIFFVSLSIFFLFSRIEWGWRSMLKFFFSYAKQKEWCIYWKWIFCLFFSPMMMKWQFPFLFLCCLKKVAPWGVFHFSSYRWEVLWFFPTHTSTAALLTFFFDKWNLPTNNETYSHNLFPFSSISAVATKKEKLKIQIESNRKIASGSFRCVKRLRVHVSLL